MTDPRHDLGERAERTVAAWLRASGWQILARRWRCIDGELDLVCRDPSGVLVGVEVRARRSARAGDGLDALTPRAMGRRRRALADYARRVGACGPGLRIDVVAVGPAGDAAGWRLRRIADAG